MNPILAEQIPLVRRPKPLGLALQTRLAELAALTDWPADADHQKQVARASGVINVAGLIASDIGLPELAETLCWRLYRIFIEAPGLTPGIAVMGLMPLTNIARLLIREGHPTEAYELLQELYHAARHHKPTTIRGQHVDLTPWTSTPEHHKSICTELWSTLLIDGARALARAGCWTHAADSLATHRGIGNRLLDGRQLQFMALLEQGHHEQATALVDSTTYTEHWETAVGALLRLACKPNDASPAPDVLDSAVHTTLGLMNDSEPTTTTFRVRLGLTTLELAGERLTQPLTLLQQAIVDDALTDAYSAREGLQNQWLRAALTPVQEEGLLAVLAESGLGRQNLSADQDQLLSKTVLVAETHLHELLLDR